MKNIIKVNAILTNVTEGNNKKPNNRTLHGPIFHIMLAIRL